MIPFHTGMGTQSDRCQRICSSRGCSTNLGVLRLNARDTKAAEMLAKPFLCFSDWSKIDPQASSNFPPFTTNCDHLTKPESSHLINGDTIPRGICERWKADGHIFNGATKFGSKRRFEDFTLI